MKTNLFNRKEFISRNDILYSEKKFTQDIYSHHGYLSLYENKSEKPYFFIVEDDSKIFIYPFLKCSIKELKSYYDVKTAYGYGGPTCNTKDENFIKSCYRELRSLLNELNIVSEVIKFNPFLDCHDLITNLYDGNIVNDRELVFISFKNINENKVLDLYKKECRKKIKKTEVFQNRMNIEIGNSSRHLKEFRKVYEENLRYNNADKRYFYNESFYEKLQKNLENNFLIFSIYIDNKVTTSQLLLFDDNNVYCHLFGALEEARKKNIILLSYHKLIEWSCRNGFKNINFGGGRGSDPNDSLLTFKKNFSQSTTPFLIGEKIINKEVYDFLCSKYGDQSRSHFQKYRKL